ncbi:hypothetical protein CUAC110533_12020 [Cutibacterium acnes subsp. elongatum]
MPTMTKLIGEDGIPGSPSRRRHSAAPVAPPMTMPGPKTPPEPPDPMDKVVERILAKGIASTMSSGIRTRLLANISCCTEP